MREISRDPADLVAQTIGRHHQYPDGLMLFLGTMFAPVQDRDAPGQGFTHHAGDVVTIAAPGLGALVNTVGLATEAPEWTFGAAALMRNLAARGLLRDRADPGRRRRLDLRAVAGQFLPRGLPRSASSSTRAAS